MPEFIFLPALAYDIIWDELDLKDRLVFRQANKDWLFIANKYFFQILNISDADPKRIDSLSKYGHLVRSLSLLSVPISFKNITKYCDNLFKLTLKRVELVSPDVTEYNPIKLHNLSLSVDGRFSSFKDFSLWFPSLSFFSHLSVLHLYEVCPLTAQHIFYSLPDLVEFKYTSNGPIIPRTWKPNYLLKLKTDFSMTFKQKFKNVKIRNLYIKSFFRINVDEDFIFLNPECFPRLEKLGLDLYDGSLSGWHKSAWPELFHLFINYKFTKIEHLEDITLSIPHLKYLKCPRLSPSSTIPLFHYIKSFKYLSHLSLDLSNCKSDIEVLESLSVSNTIRNLGLRFSLLNFRKLELLASRFPMVDRFELIGAVQSDHELTFKIAEQLNSSDNTLFMFRFPWRELVVPDFNELLVEIVRLCPSLLKFYHRFQISDIPPSEVSNLLKYTHPSLQILHLSAKDSF